MYKKLLGIYLIAYRKNNAQSVLCILSVPPEERRKGGICGGGIPPEEKARRKKGGKLALFWEN